jgi:hypothetical protein
VWALIDGNAISIVHSNITLLAEAFIGEKAIKAIKVTEGINSDIAKLLTLVYTTAKLLILLACYYKILY